MFNALTLTDFKSFAHARLELPAITTVIGANAAGKSNLRDALKFLHAAGRGLTLPEIFGGKSGVGWPGIRGGAPGTLRSGAKAAELVLEAMVRVESAFPVLNYTIEFVANGKGPLVSRESLYADGKMLFDSHPATMTPDQNDPKILQVRLIGGKGKTKGQTISFPAYQPMLSQVAEVASVRTDANASLLVECVTELRKELGAIRFIDFDPKVMRQPSVPGEKTISETGDNLSSVLRYLVEDEGKEGVLKSWIKALTPMDVAALHFEDYPDGKTLALLEEADGRKTHLSSASDGTVRFLGIPASVLSPEAPSLLCFEEIETGLHPVRVHLVTELLQNHAQDGRPQILLTTHSPMLLSWLGQQHAKGANLAYRVAGHPETRLKRFSDIPNLENALAKREAARLLETGWFEEAMFFAEGDPEPLAVEMPDEPLAGGAALKILILLEDTPNDQHMAVPLVRALCQQRGITAKVAASQERLGSVEEAMNPERLIPIIESHQGMVDLFILIVDRDCRAPGRPRGGDRGQALAHLEQVITSKGVLGPGQRFITCQAEEELETWLLAAFDDLPWRKIRDDCDPKETYFERLARERGVVDNVGGGRQELMREALGRFKRIWQLCPELQGLAARL